MLDLRILYPHKLTDSCFIDSVYYNSQMVQKNSAFVALRGEKVDGHRFVQNAFDNGAVVAIVEEYVEATGLQVLVSDTHLALAEISQKLNPFKNDILFIGVTGTDGKTSTTVIVKELLQRLGKQVGYIGTNGIEYQDVQLNLNCTTPLAPELFGILADMSDKAVDIVSMEVSSHALATKRVANLAYDYAVFTNFSRDHLDFHKTIAEYLAAKLQLFTQLAKNGKAIVNIDDDVAGAFVEEAKNHEIMTYSLQDEQADYFAHHIKYLNDEISFSLQYNNKNFEMKTKLLGEFNIYNILVAIAIAHDLGYSLEAIAAHLIDISSIPGRMELFYHPTRKFSAIVDFGHAPNAIKNVLTVSKKMTRGKLVVITGAVGDGDKSKRPLMAENAVMYADEAIFTTDQPYSEEPEVIIEEMVQNLEKDNYRIILDREAAIKTALDEAKCGDVIVIMGKGRETKIKFKDYEIEFSDYEFVKEYMENKTEV